MGILLVYDVTDERSFSSKPLFHFMLSNVFSLSMLNRGQTSGLGSPTSSSTQPKG